MPEPQENDVIKVEKTSKILEFLNRKVKETKKEQPLTRIVIRRLPPRLTKEELLNQITLPPHDSFYFVRGDLSLGQQSFSRAYVNFLNPDEIFGFKEKYDDLPFLDDQGREYHAVVEWAPVQRLRKKGSQQKLTNTGTLEADPKYTEFLEKLEKEKNNAGNPSEYFMETDNLPLKEVKVTTTPLLEFLKLKRQQKIDLRNEHKNRKKEAEKERRKKEDEARRAEKIKRTKEKDKKKLNVEEKSARVDESKNENDREIAVKGKDESKSISDVKERKFDSKSPRPIKIEKPDFKPSIRREEKHEKIPKGSFGSGKADVVKSSKFSEKTIDSGNFKQKKEGVEERKSNKYNQSERRAFPTSKIDDSTIKPFVTKPLDDKRKIQEPEKKEETKSKFRYSEQRNRDRGVRNQKNSSKGDFEALKPETTTVNSEDKQDKPVGAGETSGRIRRQSTQETSDGSVDGDEVKSSEDKKTSSGRKDPRTERRIRNKDRPSIEIYRPGMGKFSKQRLEQKKDDSDSTDIKKDEKSDTECKKSNSRLKKERKQNDNVNEKNPKADDIDLIEADRSEENTEDLVKKENSEETTEVISLTELESSNVVDKSSENEGKQLKGTETVEDLPNIESPVEDERDNIVKSFNSNSETNVDEQIHEYITLTSDFNTKENIVEATTTEEAIEKKEQLVEVEATKTDEAIEKKEQLVEVEATKTDEAIEKEEQLVKVEATKTEEAIEKKEQLVEVEATKTDEAIEKEEQLVKVEATKTEEAIEKKEQLVEVEATKTDEASEKKEQLVEVEAIEKEEQVVVEEVDSLLGTEEVSS